MGEPWLDQMFVIFNENIIVGKSVSGLQIRRKNSPDEIFTWKGVVKNGDVKHPF